MNELKMPTVPVLSGANVYVLIFDANGKVYQTTTETFVTYTNVAHPNCAIALTEVGTTGVYEGNFPTAITQSGTYDLLGFRRLGGSPVSSDTEIGEGEIIWDGSAEFFTDSSGNLISLSYLKQEYPLLATVGDDRLNALIVAASGALQEYLGRTFAVTDYSDEYQLDNATASLVLRHVPIVAIDTITLQPYDTDPEAIDGAQYVTTPHGEIVLKPTSTATPFFPASLRRVPSVRVEYSAGYATVPASVQAAAALVVANLYYVAQRDPSLQSEKIGSYSYTLRSAALGYVTATAEVKELVGYYRDPIVV